MIPSETDQRPFSPEQVDAMQARVQAAADQSITAVAGDGTAARVLLWQSATGDPELAQALVGLLILALR